MSSGLTAGSSAPVIRENNLSLSTSMLLDTESLEYYILLEAGIDQKGSALIELEKDWNIRVTSCYHFFSVVGWDVGRRSMDAPNIYLSIPANALCLLPSQVYMKCWWLTSYLCEGEEKKTSLETGAGLAWRRVAASSRRCAGAFISGGTTPVTAGTRAINING